jgi:hypothetical protein
MMANRDGLFHGFPLDIGVAETGPNNLATVTVLFGLCEEKQANDWVNVAAEEMQITGYFYLETRDGQINEFTVKALREAFGWDGVDPFWFMDQAAGLAEKPVQLKLGWEEYEGKRRLKVQFLNPYGATGSPGITKADDTGRRAIANRLGSKLRAMSGGAQVKTPKPSGAPQMPKKPAAGGPPPKQSPQAGGTATLEGAWETLARECQERGLNEEQTTRTWFDVLDKLFPGREAETLTPAECYRLKTDGPGLIVIPF